MLVEESNGVLVRGLAVPGDREAAIELLRLSPSALRWALERHQIFYHYDDPAAPRIDPGLDKVDRDMFIQNLFALLFKDFRARELHHFYYRVKGLQELDMTVTASAKFVPRRLLQAQFRDRFRIGEAAECIGGGLILVKTLDAAPEPWDERQPSAPATPVDNS